jgi:hypothetical protein
MIKSEGKERDCVPHNYDVKAWKVTRKPEDDIKTELGKIEYDERWLDLLPDRVPKQILLRRAEC